MYAIDKILSYVLIAENGRVLEIKVKNLISLITGLYEGAKIAIKNNLIKQYLMKLKTK